MKLKKLLITGILALSCIATPVMASAYYYCPEGTTYNVELGDANVKLANVEKRYPVAYSRSGGHSFYDYKLTFLVRNCTYDKNIVVHSKIFEDEDEWTDSESAKYVRTLSDNNTPDTRDDIELWEVDIAHQAGTPFCVWYKEVNSWDNNNEADYVFE